MKLIKSSFEILEQPTGEEGMYKQIEKVGRVCWKSENKITEDSYKKFIEMLKNKQHFSVLEHGTVYLQYETVKSGINPLTKYYHNKYSEAKTKEGAIEETIRLLVTTNLRVLVENNWLDDLKYLCEPTEYHEKRITVKFTMDRIGSQSFCRHRVFSFAQESTRYCNYSKDKFGGDVTFIIPSWVNEEALPKGTIINHDDMGDLIGEYYFHLTGKEEPYFKPWEITPEMNFIASLQISEQLYLELINQGWKPQQARSILPNSLKTELVMTGFVDDWKHFFELRCTSSAHPQARELAEPLYSEFIKRGYFNEKNY